MRIVDSTGFGEIRAAFLAKRHQTVRAALKSAQFSLGGLLEAAVWIADSSHDDQDGRSILADSTPDGFKSLMQVLSHGADLSVDFSRNGVGCARSIGRLDSGDRAWTEYLMGFHAALVQNGYDKSYARALAQSLHEMADNVRQHAGTATDTSPPGMAGWHVANGVAAFAVVDIGRGVKESLLTNRHWAHLQS